MMIQCQDRGVVWLRAAVMLMSGWICVFLIFPPALRAQESEAVFTFAIKGFAITGNTLLPEKEIYQALVGFTGPEQTTADVENARDKLEKLFHEKGYPAVLVNIPEQAIDDGLIELEVIETRIRRVRIKGNRYFTMESIKKKLPSLTPGKVLYVPRVQNELVELNRNPDLKVTPMLSAGRDPGTIDVELEVEDRLPLHGSLELNNRNSHDTSDLRLNAIIRYDNLWQKEHSLSLQYQTSPEEPEEVQVFATSYVLPMPWQDDHLLALYAVLSDSETAFGEGFAVNGKGNIYGLRYVMLLPGTGTYLHNLTVGLDYKDFDETLGFAADEDMETPITYLPLSFAYNASLADARGVTRFSSTLNLSFRDVVADPEEFEIKRYQGQANYLYLTLGLERTQNLPAGLGLFLKLDGQIANHPLISNEQYAAGGMESVRGYKESEVFGDDAFRGTVELAAPELVNLFGWEIPCKLLPFVFYDYAELYVKDALPEQDKRHDVSGAGCGVRGEITRFLEYEVDWAVALEDTDRVAAGDHEIYCRVKGHF